MKLTSRILASGVVFALVSIGAHAQSDPGSEAPTDPINASAINASAPSGTYTEAVVQVVFSDETAGEHPLSVTDLDNAAPEIHKFFSQLSYGKLDMGIRFIRVFLTTIPEKPATPATWANFQSCGNGCNLTVDATNAALVADSTFLNGVNGISILVLQKYAAAGVTGFGLERLSGTYTAGSSIAAPRGSKEHGQSYWSLTGELGRLGARIRASTRSVRRNLYERTLVGTSLRIRQRL